MNFDDLNPPYIEIPPHYLWYRIQRVKARSDSVRTRGFVLAPAGSLAGRFDLADEPTAYLADTEVTALYESLFRRETLDCTLDQIKMRALVTFRTKAQLRLVDVRGAEERFPVLQSLRYESTQAFAKACREDGAHGVIYASAQHSTHACICLFPEGIKRMSRIAGIPLVENGTERLHRSVVIAARGSEVPIIR